MKALLVVFVGSLAIGAPAFAQDDDPNGQFPETAPPHRVLIHPHRRQRDDYLWGTFGPPGIGDAILGASIGQVLDTPAVWGQSRQAYFKRFGTEYAESAINSTTRYMLARVRDEDPSFHPCTCTGFRRRALHAIVSPLVAYRFDDGRPQFSVARMGGAAMAGFVSGNTWKPGPQTAGAQLAHVGVDLASTMGVNLLREFLFHRDSR